MPEIICMSCSNCGSTGFEAIKRVENVTVNGIKEYYMSEQYRCLNCGNIEYTPTQCQRDLIAIKAKLSERNINVRID